jgi:hypothetical protein
VAVPTAAGVQMLESYPPSLLSSPVFLLVALLAARSTKDRALERLVIRRLASLGIRVTFGRAPARHGRRRGRE